MTKIEVEDQLREIIADARAVAAEKVTRREIKSLREFLLGPSEPVTPWSALRLRVRGAVRGVRFGS